MRRAERHGHVAATLVRFDHDNRIAALKDRAHHRREPDRPAAENDDRRPFWAFERTHDRSGACLQSAAQGTGDLQRHLVTDFHHIALPGKRMGSEG